MAKRKLKAKSINVLIDPIKKGDVKKAFELLDAGADPNAPHHTGETPLIAAITEHHDIGLVKRLLAAGADITKEGNDEKNSLPDYKVAAWGWANYYLEFWAFTAPKSKEAKALRVIRDLVSTKKK